MVLAMDAVADIVKIAGNVGELTGALWMVEARQYIFCNVPDQPRMALTMFGVSQRAHKFIGALQERRYLWVTFQPVYGENAVFGRRDLNAVSPIVASGAASVVLFGVALLSTRQGSFTVITHEAIASR
jgi:hypothetical protein